MNVRAICEGAFTLPLPIAEAMPLFTPEGERPWAGASWDPVYAIPDAVQDDSAPGTVFTKEGAGGRATWVVLGRSEHNLRYARIAPDRIAGTVTVVCSEAASPDETRVSVRYDVTSLGPDGVGFVEELESGYNAFLDDWRGEILTGLPA